MIPKLNIQRGVVLAPLTTFRTGGAAEYYAVAKDEDELRDLALYAREHGLPITVLGGGSNVVVSDQGVKGLVIKNEISGIDYEEEGNDVLVTVGSGVVWDDLVADTVARGLWGMENLSAIPGTVGATPIQNVGAYGVEIDELIVKVRVYDQLKDLFKEMDKGECGFGYRDSIFKTKEGKRYLVTAVMYKLSPTPTPKLHYKDLAERFGDIPSPTLADVRQAVIEIRAGKFPDLKALGTAGSFFKNPIITSEHFQELQRSYPDIPNFPQADGRVKVPLGWILDRVCALRGVRDGNVGAYENQSLVLVNYGGATADEIEEFAKKISDQVFEKTKIKIEWEANKI